jgi:hypothetical protein
MFFKNILEDVESMHYWYLDNGGHNLIQAYEVSIATRVSAAKSETRREGEEGGGFEEGCGAIFRRRRSLMI